MHIIMRYIHNLRLRNLKWMLIVNRYKHYLRHICNLKVENTQMCGYSFLNFYEMGNLKLFFKLN